MELEFSLAGSIKTVLLHNVTIRVRVRVTIFSFNMTLVDSSNIFTEKVILCRYGIDMVNK